MCPDQPGLRRHGLQQHQHNRPPRLQPVPRAQPRQPRPRSPPHGGFRAFAGTLSFDKVVAYVRLCVGLAERAAKAKRVTDWQAKEVSPTSPIYRKGGRGQTALTRLLYQLGWVKGRQHHVHGELAGEGLPNIERSKAQLRRLAKIYDASA